MPEVYYFGCDNNQSGHYLFAEDQGRSLYGSRAAAIVPWWKQLDAGFAPKGHQVEGVARLTHTLDGWTVLSFWDRSVDTRPGSHSTFLIRGHHDYEAARSLACAAFPRTWGRYRFQVTPRETEE